jgi:hypothetical protein
MKDDAIERFSLRRFVPFLWTCAHCMGDNRAQAYAHMFDWLADKLISYLT